MGVRGVRCEKCKLKMERSLALFFKSFGLSFWLLMVIYITLKNKVKMKKSPSFSGAVTFSLLLCARLAHSFSLHLNQVFGTVISIMIFLASFFLSSLLFPPQTKTSCWQLFFFLDHFSDPARRLGAEPVAGGVQRGVRRAVGAKGRAVVLEKKYIF